MWDKTYMSERRSKSRVPLRVAGQIDFGKRTVPCLLVDLSEHGLSVLTNASEQPEGAVQVRFRLGGRDAAEAAIDVELVSCRSDMAKQTSLWGLRSIGLDLGTRTRVRDFVQARAQ